EPENRRTGEPENRRTGEPENRRTGEPENRRVAFGLDPQWVLYEGRPIASALVMSHEDQRAQLAAAVPEALGTAVVAGDACYDRLLTSLPWRPAYRRALGADDRTLITISSTWWSESLLGRVPDVFSRVLDEFPSDEHRFAAILHPNIWYGHGRSEVHRLLARHLRAGLVLVPPEFGWRATLIASDYLIGDHGSVTTYGAVLGIPTLLGSFPAREVAPGSLVDVVGARAPRLAEHEPIGPRLAAAERAAASFTDLGGRLTSRPGEAAGAVRRVCYELLELPEPEEEPPVPPDDLSGLPAPAACLPTASRARTEVEPDGGLRVVRHPVDLPRTTADGALVVAAEHPGRSLREAADVLVLTTGDWGEHVHDWLRDALDARPGSLLAAAVQGDACLVRTRSGRTARISPRVPGAGRPMCFAAAVHGWLAAGRSIDELGPETSVNGVRVQLS
ncbi:hypothetical protein LCD35_16235, partial [Saccharopolyspora sp. 6V]|nr:hypothetical protein [Saccharopolyspora sp. 6T]MCA1193705.1 hypothetical protein [Saccharopolyspora sp. 6V]MCA1227440.1 hypothetical protein [Saccharopolyspora sp. 6M]MCA1282053.1 hypothetical protein [Saccharopolyspora sp. 7B]